MGKTFLTQISIADNVIPVKVYVEKRQNTRASLGSKYVNLRIPQGLIFKPDVQKHLKWLEGWLKQVQDQKPQALYKYFNSRNYENGDIIRLYDIDYSIHISLDSEATLGKIKLLNKEIWITIPNNKEYDRQKLIKHLLIKGCQKFFKPRLSHRVLELNTKYFEKEISTIKLKYNKSNWGSCSSSKNLNFSVRLLLAPSEVIDYVIIHELTHLVEMNHSDRFWSIVSKIVPSYKESEKFLKMYNHSLDF